MPYFLNKGNDLFESNDNNDMLVDAETLSLSTSLSLSVLDEVADKRDNVPKALLCVKHVRLLRDTDWLGALSWTFERSWRFLSNLLSVISVLAFKKK